MFFANNSKTITDREKLTWGKNDQHDKIYLMLKFQKDLNIRYRVMALEMSIFNDFRSFWLLS